MINFHKRRGGIATLALDNRDQKDKGVVVVDEKSKVIKFVEKPEKEIIGGLVNSGLYLFNRKILDYIPECFSDFGFDILPKLLEEGEGVYGFNTGNVIDIGTPEDLEKARNLFSEKNSSIV